MEKKNFPWKKKQYKSNCKTLGKKKLLEIIWVNDGIVWNLETWRESFLGSKLTAHGNGSTFQANSFVLTSI